MSAQVEVRKYKESAGAGEGGDEPPPGVVVRSCVTPLPPGYERVEVIELIDDIWGLDGFDT
jgi:hypothetical protein